MVSGGVSLKNVAGVCPSRRHRDLSGQRVSRQVCSRPNKVKKQFLKEIEKFAKLVEKTQAPEKEKRQRRRK